MRNYSYNTLMKEVGAYLELKLDMGDDRVGVGELALALTSISDSYEDYAVKIGASGAESRFEIRNLRKGSAIIEIVGYGIGLMDQAIILQQFHALIADRINWWSAKKASLNVDHKDLAQARKIEGMARAVAESEDGNLALAYKRETTDETEILLMTKQDAQRMLENFARAHELQKEKPIAIDYDTPQRVLMRLYQHNQDPNPSDKKRTSHKAVIRDIDLKPRPLTYAEQSVVDELNDIISIQPYASVIFDVDVSFVRENKVLKAYRLEKIHGYFEDDDLLKLEP